MHSQKSEAAHFQELRVVIGKILAGYRFGVHRSFLRGKGTEFKGLRPYDSADSLSQVDWAASARLSEDDTELVSRIYEPERALSVVCLVDNAQGMRHPLKKMQASEFLLWLFALSAFKYRDNFSCIFFSKEGLSASERMTREEVLYEFLRDVEHSTHQKKYAVPGRNLSRYLNDLRLHDALIVVISDFWEDEWQKDAYRLKYLSQTGKNIRIIYFALDEWSEITPLSFSLMVKNPAERFSRPLSFWGGAEIKKQQEAQEKRFAAVMKAVRAAGGPFISVPIFGNFARKVQGELFKTGFE